MNPIRGICWGGLLAAVVLGLSMSAPVWALTDAECVKLGGACNNWSETCDEGFGYIGLCIGTLKNSACCKPNPGGAVFGQPGVSNPEAAQIAKCTDQKGICAEMGCPADYTQSGICEQTAFTTKYCCLPKPGTAAATGAAPAPSAGSPVTLTNPLGNVTLIGLLGRFVSAFLGMVGALALLVFIYAGVMYMTAGSSDRVKKATETMKYAVIGLAAIMLAYFMTDLFIKALTQNPPTPPSAAKTNVTLPTQ